MLLQQHAKGPQIIPQLLTPEELLVAIESVVFVPRVFGVGKLLLKIVEAMVTDHLPFFISEVCIL
jgi:hypothetical protein